MTVSVEDTMPTAMSKCFGGNVRESFSSIHGVSDAYLQPASYYKNVPFKPLLDFTTLHNLKPNISTLEFKRSEFPETPAKAVTEPTTSTWSKKEQ